MSQDEQVVDEAPEPTEELGQVVIKVEYEDGIAKGLSWEWEPLDGNLAIVRRDALDPMLQAWSDKLGRDFRKQRRLSNYNTAADFVAPEVTDGEENGTLNGSTGSTDSSDS